MSIRQYDDPPMPITEDRHYEYPSENLDFFAINVGGKVKYGSTPRENTERLIVCLGQL